tara:strand:+ start:12156 stop:12698 length:543 start_codon:yes stop_codon:yes gene_type:complete
MKKTQIGAKSYEEALERAQNKSKQSLIGKKHLLKRTKIRLVGTSTKAELKAEIQAILRQIVIARDGGCFLRNYESEVTPQYRNCGGYRNDDDLILQAEHLHSRSNANSFSDSRLVVCVCQRHHIYYKPQHSAEYNLLARKFIGEKKSLLWDKVISDRSPVKVDLKLELIVLKQELKKYEK